MPSKALGKYEGAMMKDVNRMIETHASIQNGSQGNKGLGHLTRSGVLLLCAAWELYIEELMVESLKECISRANGPQDLHQTVQKTISDYVRGSKHQLKPLAMAGDGWKTVYQEIGLEWVTALNTPKKHNIDDGFRRLLGIEDISSNWSLGHTIVDGFVGVRGDVAHRGSDAGNIHMAKLKDEYLPQLSKCAIEMDNAVSTYIRDSFDPKTFPWNRRNLQT